MGLTAFDTGVLIAFLDREDPFHGAATAALVGAISDGPTLLPGIAYAESMVALLRSGADATWYQGMLEKLRITVGFCSPEVLARGAELRARSLVHRGRRQWKLPDSLIVAEATFAGAEVMVTTDRGWPVLDDGPSVDVLTSERPGE